MGEDFSPPRKTRGQGLKSWDDGDFVGFGAGFAPGGFWMKRNAECSEGAEEDAEEQKEGLMSAEF
jgi:hypothetical protein